MDSTFVIVVSGSASDARLSHDAAIAGIDAARNIAEKLNFMRHLSRGVSN
jgi:hypothetical protein